MLTTRSGETGIQVVEGERAGSKTVKVTTTYRGQESNIVINIEDPVYEIEIPLSIEQQLPAAARGAPGAAGAGGGAGDFQDLLIAQYVEKAQEAMLEGDYNRALRQVNLVLLVRPDHVKAHEMKGSIYYAMGNYQLANEEWEQVLASDPSNQEVRSFQEFLKSRGGAPQPPLPGVPAGAAGPAAPAKVPGKGAAQPPKPEPPR
ncbi:MAG: hypothetical protein HY423_11575 [Candidatus Lambdaproteobacteria bacterium]|nr:hypothetical protein [Candidatus Lambdaproteobacteria bacterium]